MRVKLLFALILVSVLLFAGSYATETSDAANTTPKLEITLSKDSFNVNETLSGIIRIPLSKAISVGDEISVRLQLPMKSVEKEKTIAEALDNASFRYTQSAEIKETSNPSDSKTLSFTDGGEQSIAVKAPMNAEIEKFDMTMIAPDTSSLKDVKLDIGADEEIEWHYLGESTRWSDDYVKPEGLEDLETSLQTISDNKTKICQIIDLPLAKDFKIYAKYKRLNSAGNITAAIIGLVEGIAEEPIMADLEAMTACDLPENTAFEWGSCEIKGGTQLEYGLYGKQLVCIFSTNGTAEIYGETGLYEVKTDPGVTTTAYSCPLDDSECTRFQTADPQIKLKYGVYPRILKGDIDFSAWDTGVDSTKQAIIRIVGSEDITPTCEEADCTIELKFIANESGQFTLSSLQLKYKTGGVSTTESTFYDLSGSTSSLLTITTPTPAATAIILPANDSMLEIPLEIFNITVPKVVLTTANQGYVEVAFKGEKANDTITIGAAGAAASPTSALGMIAEARTAFSALSAATGDIQLVLKILGKDADIAAAETALSGFATRAATADTEALRAEIRAFRDSLPKEITFGSSLKDFQLIEPDDITAEIAPEEKKQDTYYEQSKVQVKASVSSFTVKDFTGAQTRYMLVKKEITAKSTLNKFDLFEVIDKSVADSRADINFEEAPSTVVKDDPIVKWFVASLAAGSKVEKKYVVKSEFDVGIDKVKTIIAPTAETGEEPSAGEEPVCGDGICTSILEDAATCPDDCTSKTPWATIIIIAAVALLLALYIGFYRGKYSLWSLTKGKKKPFTNPADLSSIKEFIKAAREKKLDDGVIKTRLHEKGWKEEQIKFAFSEMEWEKKEKAAEKPTENTSAIKDYIKTASGRGLSKEKILNNLVSKGWDKEAVKKELGL